jgi:hypothetical protein
MKNVVVGLVVTVVAMAATLVACGPSAAEIKTAKSAGYAADATTLFAEIQAVTAETYKIAEVDDLNYVIVTVPQWYNPEGGRQSAGAGDVVQVVDRSVQVMMVVRLLGTEGNFMVEVMPKTFQYIAGSPKPRELKPDDPNLPGWVEGRVDSLHLEIHKRLQNHTVQ